MLRALLDKLDIRKMEKLRKKPKGNDRDKKKKAVTEIMHFIGLDTTQKQKESIHQNFQKQKSKENNE